MEKTVVRNVAISAVLVAGLGLGGLGLAANAAESSAAADETAASAAADEETTEAAGAYTDGTYEASAKGIGGDVPVTVTIKDGKIASVEVGDNNETQGVGSKAIDQLPAEIVEANGTEGVDAVSGASVTSKAIFTAVNDCLEQASGDGEAAASSTKDASAASDKAEAATGEYKDGTYEASAKGIGGDVPVTVTIEGGVITAVEVGDNNETQGVGSKAIDQLPAEIVAANGTEGVDAVSGASVTSKAIFTAVNDALEQAQA